MNNHWLKERRRQLGITQEDLIARLASQGVYRSRSMVSSWESGKHEMQLLDREFLTALARALRWSEYDVLQAAGYAVQREGHSELGERAASIIDQLEEHERQLAINILEQFLASRVG